MTIKYSFELPAMHLQQLGKEGRPNGPAFNERNLDQNAAWNGRPVLVDSAYRSQGRASVGIPPGSIAATLRHMCVIPSGYTLEVTVTTRKLAPLEGSDMFMAF